MDTPETAKARRELAAADQRWRKARQRAEEASAERTSKIKAASEAGLSLRAIAEVLGVDHTRVRQILKSQ